MPKPARAIKFVGSPMSYRLRDGLYCCSVGARVIFLDITENRYFALPSAGVDIFRRLVSRNGEEIPGSEAALTPLIEKGYLVRSSAPNPGFPKINTKPATHDFESSGPAKLHLPAFLLALVWEFVVSWRLRWCTLRSVIEQSPHIRSDKEVSQEIRNLRIQRVASAFCYSGLIFGRADRCLPRSLAMYFLCRSWGVPIQCIIGVRSDPFAAHAWTQDGGRVLNDSAEQVRHYSPILVLS